MQVLCPQCGAPVEAWTESRFYHCSYCGSSFIIQEGEGLSEYVFTHERDDRMAWSALASYLEAAGCKDTIKQCSTEFMVFPFWLCSINGERSKLIPALSHPCREIGMVTLPTGDMIFVDKKDEYPEPTVSLAEARGKHPDEKSDGKWSLVHIPLYFMEYLARDLRFSAVVSGSDGKAFAAERPSATIPGLSVPHAAMILIFALTLIIEGVLIRNNLVRAGAFLLTFGIYYPIYHVLLKREEVR